MPCMAPKVSDLMKIRLQRMSVYAEYLTIDVQAAESSLPVLPNDSVLMCGQFERFNEIEIGLFAMKGELWICFNKTTQLVSPALSVTHVVTDLNCKLTISVDEIQRVIVRYEKPNPICTVFYSQDDEDVDFGLWLSNVLKSEERKQILIENWPYCLKNRGSLFAPLA